MASPGIDQSGGGRLAARVLAPLAIVACLVAVAAVISANTSSSEEEGSKRAPRTQQVDRKKDLPEEYVVEPGDTVSGIAEETGVSVDALLRLNPDLDPQTLNSGETIKLRK